MDNESDSEVIFEGKVFNVEQRNIKLDTGKITRQVVTHKPVVAVVAQNPDFDILITGEYRVGQGDYATSIPAGTVEDDEDPSQTAERELVEETGFVPSDLKEIGVVYSSEGFTDEVCHLFVCEVGYSPEEDTNFDDDENVSYKFIDKDTVLNGVTEGFMSSGHAVSAILMANAKGLL